MTTLQLPSLPRFRLPLLANVVLVLLVLVLGGLVVTSLRGPAAVGSTAVPQSAALERATGVRFSRVAVVGDGGLLTVSYVVLDPERATAFQADRDHPPLLTSEAREASTQRVSIMRAGHQMRAGQTYYLVYENTAGALEGGEKVTLTYDGVSLRHLPVLG